MKNPDKYLINEVQENVAAQGLRSAHKQLWQAELKWQKEKRQADSRMVNLLACVCNELQSYSTPGSMQTTWQ